MTIYICPIQPINLFPFLTDFEKQLLWRGEEKAGRYQHPIPAKGQSNRMLIFVYARELARACTQSNQKHN
jgi:hypothetical protein